MILDVDSLISVVDTVIWAIPAETAGIGKDNV